MIRQKTLMIRPYNDRDLDAVLDLIKRSDSTDRSKETWIGNDMTAMLAFEDARLVGIIPFERRRIVLDAKTRINALWVSAAHVEPDCRSQGIGTRLDNAIKDTFSSEFEVVFVIREDEQSAAYRWYKKLGYHHLSNIVSLKLDVVPARKSVEFTILKTKKEFKDYGPKLKHCFDVHIGPCGGYPERDEQFWKWKIDAHYYKEHYGYKIIVIEGEQDATVKAYAFLGKTNLRDGVDRFDILEIIVPEDEKIRSDLVNAVLVYAHQMQCRELRIQLAEQDPLVGWFKSFGFTMRWKTNLLGKCIRSDKQLPKINWKFFHIDYI